MPKRSPITSPSESVRIMQGAVRELAPPSHIPLDDVDWPFWHSVVAEFAKAEWTEHQLELAAMLARSMANVEGEQRALRYEGHIIERPNGTKVENPRARAVQSLTQTILGLRRSLAMHGRAKSGDSRTDAKRRDTAKKAEQQLDDDLIARPDSFQ